MSYRYTAEEGRLLLALARQVVAEKLGLADAEAGMADDCFSAPCFHESRGVFVTLHQRSDHALRGCIGSIITEKPVVEGVRENAGNAAFRDPRFAAVDAAELEGLCFEISILSEPEKQGNFRGQALLDRIQPGTDGVMIRTRGKGATFLPQVWAQLPEPRLFISQLCLKAGLAMDAWQTTALTLYTYQVQSFEEEG